MTYESKTLPRTPIALRFAALCSCLALLLGLLATSQAALAQTSEFLVRSTTSTKGLGYSGRTYDFAQAFTTGTAAAGYKLTSVNVDLTVPGGSSPLPKYEMELWSDSSGAPGRKLVTLNKPASLRTGVMAFSAPGVGIDLAASTTYHVVWNVAKGQGRARAVTVGFTKTTSEYEEEQLSGGRTKITPGIQAKPGWSITRGGHYRSIGITAWTKLSASTIRMAIWGYEKTSSVDLTLSALKLEYRVSTSPEVYRSVDLNPAFDRFETDYTATLERPQGARGNGTVRFTLTTKTGDVNRLRIFVGTNTFASRSLTGLINNRSTTVDVGNGANNYRLEVTGGGQTRNYRVALTEVLAPTLSVSVARKFPDPNTPIYPNTIVNLEATTNRAIASYAWSATDSSGNDVTSSVSPGVEDTAAATFSTATAGTYTVHVTATDEGNNTASTSTTVTVVEDPNEAPTVTIGPSDSSIVLGNPHFIQVNTDLSLTATAADSDGTIASYIWRASTSGATDVTGDVLTGANTATAVFNATAAGEYIIGVTVFDDGDPSAQSAHADIKVTVTAVSASSDAKLSALRITAPNGQRLSLSPAFSPTTYAYSATVSKNTGSVNVTATVNSANATLDGSYPWTPRGEEPVHDLPLSSGVAKSVAPIQAGDNVLTVKVTAQDGTRQDYTVTLNRKARPTIALTPSGPQNLALNTDLTLTANANDPDGGNIPYYIWYVTKTPGYRNVTRATIGSVGYTDTSVTFNAAEAGEYTVWMWVWDDEFDYAQLSRKIIVGSSTLSPPLPELSVADSSANEPAADAFPYTEMDFVVTLSKAANTPVSVRYETADGTATSGHDYLRATGRINFRVGETSKIVRVWVLNDTHDDDGETFTLTLSNATGATIVDGQATGTINNADPMPAAWLARFGRSVAEQALDGISARLKAPRVAGVEAKLGGQSLTFRPGDESSLDPTGAALQSGSPETGLETGQSRTMTTHEFLMGSSFSMTGSRDSSGGSIAFWGRGSETRFEGRDDRLDLDGTVTSGILGADYSRDHWILGLAVMQSEGDGGYADPGNPSGKISSSLTSTIPYAALQTSERFSMWGAAGFGNGDVTLEPDSGPKMEADIDWTMAAVGIRNELLAPDSPSVLALIADGLWTRTNSDQANGIVATESAVSRFRIGLEGSWPVAMEGGSRFVPRLAVGARHDDGDAETGAGIELGGGVAWSDPGSGLSFEVEGRTLVAHEASGVKDRGYAASLTFDSNPTSQRGMSFGLRQEWGGQANGGIDALFTPDPLSGRRDVVASDGHWTAEAAYGLPAFDGGFTASPYVGLGFSSASRNYSLGWKVTPESASAANLSFDIAASRHEREEAEPENRIGFEITLGW